MSHFYRLFYDEQNFDNPKAVPSYRISHELASGRLDEMALNVYGLDGMALKLYWGRERYRIMV